MSWPAISVEPGQSADGASVVGGTSSLRRPGGSIMKIRRIVTHVGYSAIGVLVLMSLAPSPARAADDQTHAQHNSEQNQATGLIKIVRESTERFRDVTAAEAEGYGLLFGCVTGPDWGAMGLHYVNLPLVFDGELDATHPEIVIYEPLPNGRLKMTGADFLVLKDAWDKNHPAPPELMGQLFHLFEAPNRFGLPAFYTLHVWAWKENPKGAFVNWHPKVSCAGFAPQEQ
jgi:hypothetical protein